MLRISPIVSLLLALVFASATHAQNRYNGTPGRDILLGTNDNDEFFANGGNDHIQTMVGTKSDNRWDSVRADDGGDDIIICGPEDIILADPGDLIIVFDTDGKLLFYGPYWLFELIEDIAYELSLLLEDLAELLGESEALLVALDWLLDVRDNSPVELHEGIDQLILYVQGESPVDLPVEVPLET